jgi:hypothetical protein
MQSTDYVQQEGVFFLVPKRRTIYLLRHIRESVEGLF